MTKTHEHKRVEIMATALADHALALQDESERHYRAKCETAGRHAEERARRQALEVELAKQAAELKRMRDACQEVIDILANVSGPTVAAPVQRAHAVLYAAMHNYAAPTEP